MRLVIWNCAGKAHERLPDLLPLRPDVVVLSECASPVVQAAQVVFASAASSRWVGSIKTKGLAVLTFGPFRLADPDHPYTTTGRWALPVRVTGPVHFNLLAVWAQGSGYAAYVSSVEAAIQDHQAFLASGPAVVAGDLNSNACWDGQTQGGHTRIVRRLGGLGLQSAYHRHFREAQGGESRPTHFHMRSIERPYHLDYAFVPTAWADVGYSVEVGSAERWLETKLSDHMPVVVEVGALGAAGADEGATGRH